MTEEGVLMRVENLNFKFNFSLFFKYLEGTRSGERGEKPSNTSRMSLMTNLFILICNPIQLYLFAKFTNYEAQGARVITHCPVIYNYEMTRNKNYRTASRLRS